MVDLDTDFIFYHIEKCAGTSMRQMLYVYFSNIYKTEQIFIPEYSNNINYNFLPENIDLIKTDAHFDFTNLKVILSHLNYGIFPQLDNKCKFKFTIIRDPVERLISQYNFFKTTCKFDDSYFKLYGNYIAKYLGCIDENNKLLTGKLLDNKLNEYNFIMILENIDSEIKLLNTMLNHHFNVKYDLPMIKLNTSQPHVIEPKLRNHIKQYLKDDYIIYNKIKQRNDRLIYSNLNWQQYRLLNTDIKLLTENEYRTHYLHIGSKENRMTNIYDKYPDFDYVQYQQNYKELVKYDKSFLELHWLKHGIKEGRTYKMNVEYMKLNTCINNKLDWRQYCVNNMNRINMIDLEIMDGIKQINAVLVEFRILENLEFIIKNCILKLKNKCFYTVVCGNVNFDYITSINSRLNNILSIIKLDYDNIDIDQYSSILTTLSFWENLQGEYILIYQEDSCIFKENIEDFLSYDYIGAPWSKTQNDNLNSVGNGGFSLRNRIKMINVINYIKPIDMIYNSSTLNYMTCAHLLFPPEDVYFSKALIDYKLGIVADYDKAFDFSTESIFNPNSFGGHNFWLKNNKLDILDENVIIKFKPMNSTKNEHRGGWATVVSNLKNNNFYSNYSNIMFIDIMEEYFLWNTTFKLDYKWCGILHLTCNVPKYLNICELNNIFNNTNFINSLKYCVVIFTLSNYLKQFLLNKFKTLNINVPIINMKHPIDTNVQLFNIDKYKSSNNKNIIQIGQQLRIMSSIYRINIPNHNKIWLTGTRKIQYLKNTLQLEIEHLKIKINTTGVEMKYIENYDEYDLLLTKNIVFIHLYDASANNTVIECIIRNTPIIVNRLESVVEYLGADYPLYFDSLDEIPELINIKNIEKAHNYLVSMDKTDLSFTHFNKVLSNSIYKYF